MANTLSGKAGNAPGMPGPAPEFRRARFIIGIAVLIAVILATVAIIVNLQRTVQDARDKAALLNDLHETSLRLSALEWEAMNDGTISAELQGSIDAALAEHAGHAHKLAEHADTPALKRLLSDQRRYAGLIKRQIRAVAEGRRDVAAEIDEAQTDPLYDRIYERMREITEASDRRIRDDQKVVNWTSMGLVAVCLLTSGLLLRRNFAAFQRQIESQQQLAAVRHREEYLVRLMENADEMLAVIDVTGTIHFISGAVLRLTSMRQHEVVGRRAVEFCHPDDWPRAENMLGTVVRQPGVPSRGQFRLRGAGGDWRDIEIAVTNMLDDPLISGLIINIRDITQRLRDERQLHDMAYKDLLTGLPNRSFLTQTLESRISVIERGETFALLFIDLDNFKYVNDSDGHEAGDGLLLAVSRRLQESLPESGLLARWGGDEFLLLVEPAQDELQVREIAERLLQGLARPFELSGQEIVISATIGITIAGRHEGLSVQSVLRQADHALHEGKLHRKGGYRFYDGHGASAGLAAPRMRLMTDLHRAIDRGEIEVHYQPIVSLADGRLEHAEALLRWRHRERGIVANELFLAMAEDNVLIERLGREVFRQTVADIAYWQTCVALPPEFCVHVNFSPRELRAPGFARMAVDTLFEYGVPAERICMEITERSLLVPGPSEARWANELVGLGLKLCLDDFGTGYSSLSNLHEFPLSALKVDKSFVARLASDASAAVVLDAVRSVADAFSLRLIAEGVETEEQRQRLRALRYAHGQGYLFSAALPVDEFAARYLVPADSGNDTNEPHRIASD
jgi:diguanylate cyclase (GGDEF)-like protein/PAS domain S-box-containing protein